jgi:trimeric autotransporter adhesin
MNNLWIIMKLSVLRMEKISKQLEVFFPKNDPQLRLNYSFIDNAPLNGTSYYRLKEIEENNKEFRYGIRGINRKVMDVQLYPNPITDDLNINFGKDLTPGALVTIYDVLGNVVYYKKINERASELKIDMNECAKGMYFLSIKSGDLVMQQKFFKD